MGYTDCDDWLCLFSSEFHTMKATYMINKTNTCQHRTTCAWVCKKATPDICESITYIPWSFLTSFCVVSGQSILHFPHCALNYSGAIKPSKCMRGGWSDEVFGARCLGKLTKGASATTFWVHCKATEFYISKWEKMPNSIYGWWVKFLAFFKCCHQ